MKIVFMGTPDFAVPSLSRLLADGHEIVGVFTQPDKPKGRGHRLAAPPVKELALRHGLPVYQPKTLKTGEALALLRELAPELAVVVAYGKLLPPGVLEAPARGCINVHASLLPKYRGAGPIQWSVLNGEKKTGVTTQFMAEKLDTGHILLQAETAIGENETAGELHDRLSELGAPLLAETIRRLEAGTLAPIPQDETQSSYAPMLTKELSRLDFSRSARELHNQVRGLSPWPCAETFLQGKRLKIYRSEIVHTTDRGTARPGAVVDSREFVVQTGDGQLRFTEAQAEGARRMSGAELLRGFHQGQLLCE